MDDLWCLVGISLLTGRWYGWLMIRPIWIISMANTLMIITGTGSVNNRGSKQVYRAVAENAWISNDDWTKTWWSTNSEWWSGEWHWTSWWKCASTDERLQHQMNMLLVHVPCVGRAVTVWETSQGTQVTARNIKLVIGCCDVGWWVWENWMILGK